MEWRRIDGKTGKGGGGEGEQEMGEMMSRRAAHTFARKLLSPPLCIVGLHIGILEANENIYIDQVTHLP